MKTHPAKTIRSEQLLGFVTVRRVCWIRTALLRSVGIVPTIFVFHPGFLYLVLFLQAYAHHESGNAHREAIQHCLRDPNGYLKSNWITVHRFLQSHVLLHNAWSLLASIRSSNFKRANLAMFQEWSRILFPCT